MRFTGSIKKKTRTECQELLVFVGRSEREQPELVARLGVQLGVQRVRRQDAGGRRGGQGGAAAAGAGRVAEPRARQLPHVRQDVQQLERAGEAQADAQRRAQARLPHLRQGVQAPGPPVSTISRLLGEGSHRLLASSFIRVT